jgi:hypothetical protein
MKEDFAIIIGINDYTPLNQYGLRTLQGAINDANKIEEWISSITGGKVPHANIKKIISNPNPLKPLQDEIDDAFLDIEYSIKRKGGHARRLYFYFAGHGLGTLDSPNDTALCLANWSENRRQSALSSEQYKDNIHKYGYFEEIIFIADCCRNTKINIKPKSPTFEALSPGLGAGQTKLFVAYATQYQDQSFEVESANSERRGAFTTVLIDALNGAAANNGSIGADDLRDYLAKETPTLAQKNGYKQIPDVFHTYTNNTSLHLVGVVVTDVYFMFDATRKNRVELSDGNNIITYYDASQNKNPIIQLKNGLYQIRDTVTGEDKFFRVNSINNIIYVDF